MSDTYGALSVPLVASTDGSDPLLANVLSYFQAVATAYAIDEWGVVAPALRSPNTPVFRVYEHDPDETFFSEGELPALFLWRSKIADRVDVAQGVRVESGELTLFWVPPPADQNRRRIRFQFATKLLKVLDVYLERMRDPAWIVGGDLDPLAATQGSYLPTFAGFRRLHIGTSAPRPVIVEVRGTAPRKYLGWAATLPYEEELAPDITRFDLLAGSDTTISTPATSDDDPTPQPDPFVLVTDQLEAGDTGDP